jgi:hypothetical protein
MKIPSILICLAGALAAARPAAADTRAGLGFSFGKSVNLVSGGSTELAQIPMDLTNVSLPIIFEPNFKVAPELGVFVLSSTADTIESSTRSIRFGLSLAFGSMGDNFSGWAGVTGGLDWLTKTFTGSGTVPPDDSRSDWHVGPYFELEYFVNDHVSVGGKTSLLWSHLGHYKNDPVKDKLTLISTNNAAVIAFYF